MIDDFDGGPSVAKKIRFKPKMKFKEEKEKEESDKNVLGFTDSESESESSADEEDSETESVKMEEEEKEETKEKIVVDVPEVAQPIVVEDKKKEENVEIKKKTFNFPTRFVPVNR